MKKILLLLLLTISFITTAAEWELKEYVTYGKTFKDELMGVKLSENGNTIVVFKDVFLFYYVRDYDLRTHKEFETTSFFAKYCWENIFIFHRITPLK